MSVLFQQIHIQQLDGYRCVLMSFTDTLINVPPFRSIPFLGSNCFSRESYAGSPSMYVCPYRDPHGVRNGTCQRNFLVVRTNSNVHNSRIPIIYFIWSTYWLVLVVTDYKNCTRVLYVPGSPTVFHPRFVLSKRPCGVKRPLSKRHREEVAA